MSSSLRRRAVLAGAVLLAAGATGVATSPAAGAHACAEVRVHVTGSTTSVLDCHDPGTGIGDLCVRADPMLSGTGAGATVCVPA